jgi:hypothetical protein
MDGHPNGNWLLATKAKISQSTARKIIMELKNTGFFSDPELTNSENMRDQEKEYYLHLTEELFLLALHSEKPSCTNCEYVAHLATYYGTVVSTTFLLEWFKTCFFCKPNLVPLVKFF